MLKLPPWRVRYWLHMWRKNCYHRQQTIDFAKAIQEDNYLKAKQLFASQKFHLDPTYQDQHGNSLLHLAVQKNRWQYVKLVSALDCPNNLRNNQQQLPCDLTKNFRKVVGNRESLLQHEKYKKIRAKQRFFNEAQHHYRETFSGGIYPGQRRVKMLNLTFQCNEGQCAIPDISASLNKQDQHQLTLHQRLALAQQLAAAGAMTNESLNPDQTSNCYATAALTFVITKTLFTTSQQNQLIPITIPINVPDYAIYTNDQVYAHAEEVLYDYLQQATTSQQFINELKRIMGSLRQHKCYAVILDLHSTFSMCGNCEHLTYQLQNRDTSKFLMQLENELEAAGVLLPDATTELEWLRPNNIKLLMTTRVSCRRYFGSQVAQSSAGHRYPRFLGSADYERNIANHANSVVFHLDDQENTYLNTYNIDFDQPQTYQGIGIPNQTSFVMKNRQASRHRQQRQKRKRYQNGHKAGILLFYSNKLQRLSEYQASPKIFLHAIRSNKLDWVKTLLKEKLDDSKKLQELLLTRQNDETLYHAAATSNNPELLMILDLYMQRYCPQERQQILTNPNHSPLEAATDYKMYQHLTALGAQDPDGACRALLIDEDDEQDPATFKF